MLGEALAEIVVRLEMSGLREEQAIQLVTKLLKELMPSGELIRKLKAIDKQLGSE